MTAYGEGDSSAFAILYEKHKGPLYRYFIRQLHCRARAEELYQETWVRVIDSRDEYQAKAKFTTWLYRIAHNLMVDEHRKMKSQSNWLKQAQWDEEPSTTNDNVDIGSAIKACVTKLPHSQKEVFLLRHDAGFSREDICTIIAAKPETMKTRLRYALDSLRQCLSKKLGVSDGE